VSVSENLAVVRERVEAACRRAGRNPAAVTLVAVSKLHPSSAIREAYAAGQRDFGENYAQELRDKAVELADLEGLRWHAIGPLQRNKARYVAGRATLFHALDRADVGAELGRRAGDTPLACLVEVNVGNEPQKGGVSSAALPEFLAQVRSVHGLSIRGLMCIPPPDTEPRQYFQQLRQLRDALLPGGMLSMGMSDDFEPAIEEGADLVRVGTAIFGRRPFPST
jgi:pyridoxal phosphate enzyme (YggS family)